MSYLFLLKLLTTYFCKIKTKISGVTEVDFNFASGNIKISV